MEQTWVDEANKVKQQLLQQHQFEISKQRAADDFRSAADLLQPTDYNPSRSRAEEDFNRSVGERATADYYRNVARANYEFNLSRQRPFFDISTPSRCRPSRWR